MNTAVTTRSKVDENDLQDQEQLELMGGEILVKGILDQGVDTIFGYPGGVVLGVYDVLYKNPQLRHIMIRHEQGGTHAAEGYARVTGKPGVVLVTSGPGATNTVTGITNAMMDSIPMVIFTGQVASSMIGNDAFQEADIVGITRPITKHSYLVKDVNKLGDIIKEAFVIASSGRPGPVLVDLPKDMLFTKGTYKPSKKVQIQGFTPKVMGNREEIERAADLISNATKPLLYVGGGAIMGDAHKEVIELARKTNTPVTTTLMGLGAFPESDPLSLGMLGMHGTWCANMAVQECDVLIAVGARFDDRVTGRVKDFSKNSRKIHIDADASCIGKNVPVEVPIVGDVKAVLPQIIERVTEVDTTDWMNTIQNWRDTHPLRYKQRDNEIAPQYMVQKISEVTKGDAIVSVDVGQHQMWTAQYYNFNKPKSWLSSSGLGTMGFGFPASIGAAIAAPDRTVFCITGDGGFQMTSIELVTAVQYKIPIKIAIMNNGYLGMVRQWQELFYGKRYSHSFLKDSNPDFVKMAEAFGAVGFRATTPKELDEVLAKAMSINDGPVLMDIVVSPEENVYPMVSPGAAVDEMVDTEEPVAKKGK
ncbi:MAG: biosynthetic-type acetolactate synthase large subunit [Balneolales bacterium]